MLAYNVVNLDGAAVIPMGKAVSKSVQIFAHPGYHAWALHRQLCNVCLRHTIFVCDYAPDRWIRRCIWCRSTPKYRAILAATERQLAEPLDSLLQRGGTVYEATTTSPIYRRHYGKPGYTCSGYFFDKPFGRELRPRLWNQDLQNLSFQDASFDVVFSSETMEHVRRPWVGFREIRRVLKPGGFHVFTIPYRDDRLTESRVDATGDENVYTKPKVYHRDPYRAEDSLVYTDYGRDLPELLVEAGFRTTLHRILDPVHDIQDDQNAVRVFISEAV